jgi:glutaminyl-tRNA synthetase
MSRVIYLDRDDFAEDPPKDWHRLAPRREVRLRHSYVIRCERVVKDETGAVVELRCTHDPATRGADPAGRKVKGTLQWVSADHAIDAEVRLYDRLFVSDNPGASADFLADLNPSSLVIAHAKVEPSLGGAKAGDRVQLERLGFFFADPVDSKPGAPVWNRTVALKDTWAKIARADAKTEAPKSRDRSKAEAAPQAAVVVELTPEAKALRDRHGLSPEEARYIAADPDARALLVEALAVHPDAKAIARWIVNELPREAKSVRGAAIGELCALVAAGTLSGKIAKEVLAEMIATGKAPGAIVEAKGIRQISDQGAIAAAVDAVLGENADAVARFKAGNANLLGAFVGMVMKKTGGKANPKLVNELLRAKLA